MEELREKCRRGIEDLEQGRSVSGPVFMKQFRRLFPILREEFRQRPFKSHADRRARIEEIVAKYPYKE